MRIALHCRTIDDVRASGLVSVDNYSLCLDRDRRVNIESSNLMLNLMISFRDGFLPTIMKFVSLGSILSLLGWNHLQRLYTYKLLSPEFRLERPVASGGTESRNRLSSA